MLSVPLVAVGPVPAVGRALAIPAVTTRQSAETAPSAAIRFQRPDIVPPDLMLVTPWTRPSCENVTTAPGAKSRNLSEPRLQAVPWTPGRRGAAPGTLGAAASPSPRSGGAGGSPPTVRD